MDPRRRAALSMGNPNPPRPRRGTLTRLAYPTHSPPGPAGEGRAGAALDGHPLALHLLETRHSGGMAREWLSIGEAAKRTGIPVKTLRFYSDEGLVPPSGRSTSGSR